jgi:hypothetical protein
MEVSGRLSERNLIWLFRVIQRARFAPANCDPGRLGLRLALKARRPVAVVNFGPIF